MQSTTGVDNVNGRPLLNGTGNATADSSESKSENPNPRISSQERIAFLERDLRAHEIMLFAERERTRDIIEAQRAELADLKILLNQADMTIVKVYQSRSWRLTMPVRALGRILRSGRKRIRILLGRRNEMP